MNFYIISFICAAALTIAPACTKKKSSSDSSEEPGVTPAPIDNSENTSSPVFAAVINLAASVKEGDVITLIGEQSSSVDGSTLTYLWLQVSGPIVKLDDPSLVNPQFTVPPLLQDQVAEFRLIVTNAQGNTASDLVSVTFEDDEVAGYHSRACGLDMNRNGISGEEADCNVCDGVTTDPDGDGIEEDLYYVDGTSGSNGGDGSPQDPYLTIQYALDQANGPGSDKEDIVCIAGTFTVAGADSAIIKQSGVAASKQYLPDTMFFSEHPAMLVGWDKDNDGEYPPYDTDDTAIIDGAGANYKALNLRDNTISYFEAAHFSTTDFTGQHAVDLGHSTNAYTYLHDIEISDINPGVADDGSKDIIYSAGDMQVFSNIHLSNSCCVAVVSYTNQNSRFEHLYIKVHGLNGANAMATYNAQNNEVEFLENEFDAGLDTWNPNITYGLHANIGAQNIKFYRNVIRNFTDMVYVSAWNGLNRPTDEIVYDSNLFILDDASETNSSIVITTGDTLDSYVEDVYFFNNVLHATNGAEFTRCLNVLGGSNGNQSGTIHFVGNTCINSQRGISLQNGGISTRHDFVAKNNIFANMSEYNFVASTFAPLGFIEDGNVMTGGTDLFYWFAAAVDGITNWRGANTNAGTNSDECLPTFTGASGYYLDANDTCARGAGVDISNFTTVDFHGKTRPEDLAGALVDPSP